MECEQYYVYFRNIGIPADCDVIFNRLDGTCESCLASPALIDPLHCVVIDHIVSIFCNYDIRFAQHHIVDKSSKIIIGINSGIYYVRGTFIIDDNIAFSISYDNQANYDINAKYNKDIGWIEYDKRFIELCLHQFQIASGERKYEFTNDG